MSDVTEESLAEIEAARVAVRNAQEAESLNLADVARLSGVAYGTLTTFMTGKYAGRNDRVAEALKLWLTSRSQQRRTRAVLPRAPSFVATTTAASFLAALEYAQAAPDLVLITGGAGVGKTTAAQHYARQSPNVWIVTARPSLSSMQPLMEELLNVLDVVERSASRRTTAALRKLRGSGGLIIVDEAQHLQVPALEELRSLHDQGCVGLALMGNESVSGRLEGQGRSPQYAQLFSRIGTRTRRTHPLTADIDALLDAWSVEGRPLRKMLHAIGRKPGALRSVTKVLRQAHMLAIGEAAEGEAPVLTEALIERAWHRISDTSSAGAE